MKITYLHQYFSTPDMPGGTRSYEMARRLVAMGYEITMITSFREEDGRKDWFVTNESGIEVHWLPVPYSNRMSYLKRISAFFQFALRGALRAMTLETDLVFATSTPLTIAVPAVFAARWRKVPMVFEVRDLWPELPIAMGVLKSPLLRFAARKLERWAYVNASAVVALSPGMKAGVAATGYLADKIAVIPNGSDNFDFDADPDSCRAFRANRNWLKERPLLVYTGTFGKINGVSYMVELASALLSLDSDVCILLVGSGAQYETVKKEAREAGVYQVNLFLEDPLPKKAMPALLASATLSSSLFIDLPEMRSNSANKFFDALASGRPVLLNYGGWMHELITKHQCGLPMWQKPICEVAEIIDAVSHDREWLERARQAARSLAEEYFDRDILATQLAAVLEAVQDGCPEKSCNIAPGLYD